MRFYEEKDNLLNAENAMNRVTASFNEQLNQFDEQTLKITDAIYDFRKFKVDYYTSEKEKANEQDFKEKCSKRIKDRFNIDCSPENVDSLIAMFSEKAKPVLEFIENYKKELQKTYMEHCSVLRCAISSGNVEQINAVYNKENQFKNELINGVFASSGFSDLEDYIGRAAAEGDKGYGMKVNNHAVVYPDNPFKSLEEQQDSDNLLLRKNVYVYSMDASKFEPVVDFKLGEDGIYSLNFGQEWISRNDSLECEQETVDRVPREILERKQFFYQKQGVTDRELNINTQEEFLNKYSDLVANNKLGYINGELNMKNIAITDVLQDENMYLHWTPKKNMMRIQMEGLKADIGENSKQGSETTPKVFFANGIAGEIGILNRYLNLLSTKFNDKTGLYEHFKNIIGNMEFLKLELNHTDKSTYETMTPEEQEGIDFLEDDINEETGEKMTSRNMHMIVGKNLDVSKISRVDGSPFELIKQLLIQYKQKFPKQDYLTNSIDQDYLSEFVEYVTRENTKDDDRSIQEQQTSNEDSKESEKDTSSTSDKKIRIKQNGTIGRNIQEFISTKIGDKLKRAYSKRKIRKGQIKNAGQSIRETTRDRETPTQDHDINISINDE